MQSAIRAAWAIRDATGDLPSAIGTPYQPALPCLEFTEVPDEPPSLVAEAAPVSHTFKRRVVAWLPYVPGPGDSGGAYIAQDYRTWRWWEFDGVYVVEVPSARR